VDVQCERCNTRYEFDDALVSARGTKVRCTQCGHQFRLQPSAVASDRWQVLRESQSPVEFGSLRELHQAIRQGQVSRRDRLVRDGRERVIGEIAELATFFAIASSPPPKNVPTIPPPPPRTRAPSVPPPVVAMKPLAQMRTIAIGTPPPAAAIAPPPPGLPRDLVPALDESISHGVQQVVQTPSVPAARDAPGVSGIILSSPMPPPVRASMYSERPSAVDDLGGSRRSIGGWLFAGVLLLGAGVAGALVLRAHSAKGIEATKVAPSVDAEPIERLLRAGRLDEAKAALAAAANQDVQAIVSLRARVLTAIADEQWLLGRLDPSTRSVGPSRDASAATLKAFALAPDAPDVVRARIDALRILGELAAARALVEKLPTREPETAFSLAALDVAQSAQRGTLPSSVVERLTTAATAEGELGRARALLVSVLISLDRLGEARNELDRLSTLRANHPAIELLRRALSGQDAGPTLLADAAPGDAALNVVADASLPALGSSREASRAMAKRDFGQARSIYEALASKNPGDPEALTGLANVKRATGDSAGAIGDYKRALAANGSYLPAMIALADTYWSSGQQGDAMRIYREIVDRFPESAYPPHIAKRVLGSASEPAEAGAPAPEPSVKTPDEVPERPELKVAPTVTPTATPSATPPTKGAPEPEPNPGE
jgi:predicted Zn finger-like uncharacterized protein